MTKDFLETQDLGIMGSVMGSSWHTDGCRHSICLKPDSPHLLHAAPVSHDPPGSRRAGRECVFERAFP